MSNKKALIVESLSKSFGEHQVFSNLSFDLDTAELLLVRGISGSGKSTLLHIIAGLTKPDSGKIYIQGKLANNPQILIQPQERNVSLLFQDLALWPHMSAKEQLTLVAQNNRGLTTNLSKVIDETIKRVGFDSSLLDKYPSELSGGEQQRLAIARAIISKPKLLLLDEPFVALDQDNREKIIMLIKELKDEGVSIIIVSHELTNIDLKADKEVHL